MKSVCAGESLQPSQAHFVAVCLLLLSLSALFTSSLLSLSCPVTCLVSLCCFALSSSGYIPCEVLPVVVESR